MPYTKTIWVEGAAPGISGANLNHLETQYDEALADSLGKKLEPALTRWVMPGWYGDTPIQTNTVIGQIYYVPIFVGKTTTYIRIGLYVSTGAAGLADLRIFAWANGVPGALILNAGTVDTTVAGAKEIIIAQALARGHYFLAVRFDAIVGVYGLDPAFAVRPPVDGFETANGGYNRLVVLTVDAAYADPAPAPTGGGRVWQAYVYLREN